MTADGKRPNLTLVFRGAEAPIREVLHALHVGSRGRLRLTYRSARHGDPMQANVVVIRMSAVALEEQEEESTEMETIVCDARRRAHCELMDRLRVPNGCKSISIAMHEHWTDALSEKFGSPASASSVKRWRTEERQRRASWRDGHAQTRNDSRGEALKQRVRVHHAIRVGIAYLTRRQGYQSALDHLAELRAQYDEKHGTSFSSNPPFSYSTFCRECDKVGPSRRRRRPQRTR